MLSGLQTKQRLQQLFFATAAFSLVAITAPVVISLRAVVF